MDLVAIAAVAENGVIARDGEIPWDHPEDKRFYRETIEGHPVIVGRRTYGGRPRPGCTNVVMTTRDLDVPDGVVVANSVEEAVDAAVATGADTTYVIGGAGVYESLWPHLDRLVVTHVPGTPDGDRHFPGWDRRGDWTVLDEQWLTDDLRVVTYGP